MKWVRWRCRLQQARHHEHEAWARWYEDPGPDRYRAWQWACRKVDRVKAARP